MSRVIVVAIVLGVGGVAAAQTPVNTQASPDALHQVQLFENSLRAAIERAARQLADRARHVVPDIELQFLTEPRVTGVVMPEGEGFTFVVEAPAILGSSAQFWEMARRLAQSPNLPRVSSSTGGGTVTPMIVPPDPVLPPITNPEREYSEYIRQALIDAMLDNALALPIKEGQTLTLIEAGGGPTNPLAEVPRKLYLRMKGEDCIALRQTRITRDEAKKRILEWRY